MSRCHKLSCVTSHRSVAITWLSGRHKQRTIQYHQIIKLLAIAQIANIFRVPKSSHTLKWKNWFALSNKKRMQTRLLWFMKIQCGSVENYIWFTAWDGIPALVDVRSNYKPPFWPRLNFYHRWGYICPHLKCTFQPGVGWKVSVLTWLACLDLKPKLKLSFQYFDISTILQTGTEGCKRQQRTESDCVKSGIVLCELYCLWVCCESRIIDQADKL